MSAYTKEEFEQYKGSKEFLTVDHESYEDYINTFNSYVSMYKKEKQQ